MRDYEPIRLFVICDGGAGSINGDWVELPESDEELDEFLALLAQGNDPATARYLISNSDVPAWCSLQIDPYDDVRMINYLSKIITSRQIGELEGYPPGLWQADYSDIANYLLQPHAETYRADLVSSEAEVRAVARRLYGESYDERELPGSAQDGGPFDQASALRRFARAAGAQQPSGERPGLGQEHPNPRQTV